MRFIQKKWLVIILLFSLLEPLHYALFLLYPPAGKTFMGYDSDEALVSGVMRSVEFNFDNPWSTNSEKVFFNSALTSPYAYIPLGWLRQLIGIDALLMNIIAKWLFSFIFLIVLFKAMETLMPRRHELAFALFLLPLGLMPFAYALSIATGMEFLASGFSFEFAFLSNISRVYYYIPLITAFASLIFFSRGRKLRSTIALGLTFFFYPFFGFAFAGLIFLYSVAGKNGNFLTKVQQAINEVWKVLFVAALFFVPWLTAYIIQPELFERYSQSSLWWRAHLVGIVGSYFFLLGIILVAKASLVKRHWKFFGFAAVLTIVMIASELKALGVPPFTQLSLPPFAIDLTELLILALFASAWFVLEANIDRRHKFILLFALAFFPLSILNPKYAFYQQYRMGYILHIPLAMLAALYFEQFLARLKYIGLSRVPVLIIIGLIAVSSFAAYNYRFQMSPRWLEHNFFEESDKQAMQFLDTQPTGIAMASDITNYILPVWAGQYGLYHPAESQYQGGGPDREDKKLDVAAFYSGNLTAEQAKSVLAKYGITYVFYGSREKRLGRPPFESYDFLEKIYDADAEVYKTRL